MELPYPTINQSNLSKNARHKCWQKRGGSAMRGKDTLEQEVEV
jgi:hypothetical protein